MLALLDRRIGERRVRVVASDRDDGDVHPRRVSAGVLEARQRAITGQRWAMLEQVHGTAQQRVRRTATIGGTMSAMTGGFRRTPWESTSGIGDVAVTEECAKHVAMWAADCATVVLADPCGRLVGVHAGWRGLAAGVLDVACDAATGARADRRDHGHGHGHGHGHAHLDGARSDRRAEDDGHAGLDGHVADHGRAAADGDRAGGGGGDVVAVLGPVIHPCCYPFGRADLERVADGIGCDVGAIAGVTSAGDVALDVPAAVGLAFARRGVTLDVVGPCTGCDERWFSHRVRRDTGRHATIAWMEAVATEDTRVS